MLVVVCVSYECNSGYKRSALVVVCVRSVGECVSEKEREIASVVLYT